MKPGPDLIAACPRCKRRAKVPSLASGNTSGARYWTDGKIQAPMLPRRPPITPCRGCGHVYWWHDTVVGESTSGWIVAAFAALIYGVPVLAYFGVPRMILLGIGVAGPVAAVALAIRRHRQIVQPPSEAHFLEALEAGLGKDKDREMTLRLHAWWAANEPARAPLPAPASPLTAAPDAPRWSGAQEENLRRLYELLDQSEPAERLLKAEAARELGDFEGATSLLSGEIPDEQAPIAARIRELSAMRDAAVAEIAIGEPITSEPQHAGPSPS